MKKFVKIISIVALVAILAAVCFACAPSSVDKAKSKMEKAGYSTSSYTDKDAEDCDGSFAAIKSLIPLNGLYALHFKTTKAAKAYYDDVVGDSKKDAEKDNFKQEGKWVYWGSDEAVKAFTK